MRFPLICFIVSGAMVALLSACKREDPVEAYTAPKEQKPAGAQNPPPAHPVRPAPVAVQAQAGSLDWTVPEGWIQRPGDQWVAARLQVDPPDPSIAISVSRLIHSPLLENVNRWLGQLRLPPITEADLPKVVTRIEANGLSIDRVDLASEADRMLVAVTIVGRDMWFFKLAGPKEKVGAQQARFDAFIRSLRVDGPAAQAAPATRPAAGPAWITPKGWREDPAKRDFRIVAFHAGEGEKAADVIVSTMGNDQVGSIPDNITRWRRQVGLPPDATQAHTPEEVSFGELRGRLFDIANPAGGRRLIVLWVVRGGDAWFFRLSGPTAAVEAERPAFNAFLESFRFQQ